MTIAVILGGRQSLGISAAAIGYTAGTAALWLTVYLPVVANRFPEYGLVQEWRNADVFRLVRSAGPLVLGRRRDVRHSRRQSFHGVAFSGRRDLGPVLCRPGDAGSAGDSGNDRDDGCLPSVVAICRAPGSRGTPSNAWHRHPAHRDVAGARCGVAGAAQSRCRDNPVRAWSIHSV